MAERPRVMISVSGGQIQAVYADIDLDIIVSEEPEGCDPDGLVTVPEFAKKKDLPDGREIILDDGQRYMWDTVPVVGDENLEAVFEAYAQHNS